MNEFWQPWPGPTGTTGPNFLGVTGAVTGPNFFGVTGAASPTGLQPQHHHLKFLFDRVRIELVGASDTMIRMVMYETFQEFFNDTSLWLEAIPGEIFPGTKEYYLEPGNVQSLGDPFPKGRIIGLAGVNDVRHFAVAADMPAPPIIRLQFQQSNTIAVFATVIKTVQVPHEPDLPDVPPWVVGTYEPYLVAGIKGKLQQQADKPYSDPKMGVAQYQFFRQGVSIGRVRAMRRNTWGSQAWAFPQQFHTRSQRGYGVSVGNEWRF